MIEIYRTLTIATKIKRLAAPSKACEPGKSVPVRKPWVSDQ
jgi:hypothetical protein